MEENAVKTKSNVVEIRPGTTAQTDREREFVEYLLQKLRDYRELGVEVDSMVLLFTGTQPAMADEEEDGEWFSISRFIGEERPVGPTLALLSICFQKYVTDSVAFSE